MIYGYLRVSTDEQDVQSQKQGVVAFAKSKGWGVDEYITDEGVSGGKDPDKRNLGPLLKKLQKDDIVIASEISRLGRDLYMVMDILHFCMKTGCKIYTVKDNFSLDDNVQSKVLAFAFGLAAEIERQMIRQRTREGLRLRMKLGVLLGRPIGSTNSEEAQKYGEWKDRVKQMVEWQMQPRQIADIVGCDRNTVNRLVARWGFGKMWKYKTEWAKNENKQRGIRRQPTYKDEPYKIVQLNRDKVRMMIEADMTIPQIADELQEFTYEQIYDTILCDYEFNPLYRQHGQLKVKKGAY
ncbi:MAG: recombinase family protein [Prevotella sp.]|nr:recombinase family protein [Prevotella sp.]